MKTITIALILILVCVSVVLMGCAKKDDSVILLPDFNQDAVKEKSLNIGDQTSFTRFKVEINFKNYERFSS